MKYEDITDELIRTAMEKYNLDKDYQGFLDLVVKFQNLDENTNEKDIFMNFRTYIDKEDN